MELIIVIIIIVAVSNFKKKLEDGGMETGDFWRSKNINHRQKQVVQGVRDMEDVINNLKRKTIQQAKRKENLAYQEEQENRKKMELEQRRKREFEERQKAKLELQKKQEEQRQRQLEKERKIREEKELMKRFQGNNSASSDVSAATVLSGKEDSRNKNSLEKEEKAQFRVEEYLDPLTSSFYPNVEDFLSPTTASFYPNVDLSTFSLQNPPNML